MASAAVVMAAGLSIGPAVIASTQHVSARVERIQWLAHEVEDSAEGVRAGARARGRLAPRELQALRRLDALVWAARAFHEEIERRPFSRHAAEDLDTLLRTYERADQSFGILRMSPDARREQRRLSMLVARLDASYATLARGPRGGYEDHRRQDREGRR